MNKKEKAKYIQSILDDLFPLPPIPLKHKDPYTLLIAVLLSARSMDERVNRITPQLFEYADTPEKMILLDIPFIQSLIKPCGLSPFKASSIWHLSHMLIHQFGGQVPKDLLSLKSLPGVGHKTASVVLCQAFGIPAFPIDTHIHRCAKRWGLSKGLSVKQTESDLKRLFPESSWIKLHLQIIHYARTYCPARKHDLNQCKICSLVA